MGVLNKFDKTAFGAVKKSARVTKADKIAKCEEEIIRVKRDLTSAMTPEYRKIELRQTLRIKLDELKRLKKVRK